MDRHWALGGSANWKDRVGVTEQKDALAAPSAQARHQIITQCRLQLTFNRKAAGVQPLRQPILHSIDTSFVLRARINARERAQVGKVVIQLIVQICYKLRVHFYLLVMENVLNTAGLSSGNVRNSFSREKLCHSSAVLRTGFRRNPSLLDP